MTLHDLTQTFFEHHEIYWDDELLDSQILANEQALLPVVLAIIDKMVGDEDKLDKIIHYQLVIDKKALCYIRAQNVEIINSALLSSEINLFGGVAAIARYLIEHSVQNTHNTGYDVIKLCSLIRENHQQYDDGHVLPNTLSFDGLLVNKEETLTTSNEIDFADILARPTEKEESVTSKPEKQFVLNEDFPQLDIQGKEVFEEIAVVAMAVYLSKNADKKIDDLDKASLSSITADSSMFFAALLNLNYLLDKTADRFQCQGYQLIFEKQIYSLRETISRFAETRSFGDPSTTWYQAAKKTASKLVLTKHLTSIFTSSMREGFFNSDALIDALLASSDDTTQAFIKLNRSGNNVITSALASQSIKQALNAKVIGQERAIQSLCEGYLTSNIHSQQGPRAIYTFAGPSGVGKTYLASQLLSELNRYEKSGYVFSVFNMEHYTDQKDSGKLFGSGVQYVDASLGMLTQTVRAQPRQILLFDEIEKANNSVIQSLLTMIDSGVVRDQTSQEEVDFSQCIVIFTTNLGQDLLVNNPQNQTLSIFDILLSSSNPTSKSKLSPEFVNRLAKGYPIIFSPLKVNHLLRLAEQELIKSVDDNSVLTYQWPTDFAGFMLKTMSPDVSVRRLKSVFSKLKSEILSRSTPFFSAEQTQVSFKVELERNEPQLIDKPLKILLLDDDSMVYQQINNTAFSTDVALCKSRESINSAIEKQLPDALLIDLDTVENGQCQLNQFLTDELAERVKLPIFTYRIIESAQHDDSVSAAHDIREHFSIELNHFAEAFSRMIERVNYYLQVERDLSRMIRRRESLQYQCSISKSEFGFDVGYGQMLVKQIVHSEDLRGGDLFKMALPEVVLDDVIGLERAKKRLTDVVTWLKTPDKLEHLGVKIPSGFLFAGPSGTGKTLLAKAIAGESGLPFFAVTSAELSASHSGGTTDNIKKLFAAAKKYAPAIVFIDEIDAIASHRSQGTQGADKDRNLTVNALLTEMDGFNSHGEAIFVMAATNHPQLLDSAILRPGRFDETIYCDLPNAKAREAFFVQFARRYQVEFTQIELADLVASARGMSAAQIDQIFRETIYQSVGDAQLLSVEMIKQTMIRVSYGSPNEQIVLSEQEKQRTAYHEAAHLLVSKLLFPKQAIDFVTIEPRDQSLGFVATRAEEEYESLSSKRVKYRLEVLLAGRVAEKLFTGSDKEISTGASNDISKATKLAMHAIYEGGLDPDIGPVNVGMLTKFEESDLLKIAQNSVRNWIVEAEMSVEQRLESHRSILNKIAQTLIQKESLLGEEIEQLFGFNRM